MKEFASYSIDYEAAIRNNGKLVAYRKGFYTEQEAEKWVQDNIPFKSGFRYDIIAVTRRIIKCRRI